MDFTDNLIGLRVWVGHIFRYAYKGVRRGLMEGKRSDLNVGSTVPIGLGLGLNKKRKRRRPISAGISLSLSWSTETRACSLSSTHIPSLSRWEVPSNREPKENFPSFNHFLLFCSSLFFCHSSMKITKRGKLVSESVGVCHDSLMWFLSY